MQKLKNIISRSVLLFFIPAGLLYAQPEGERAGDVRQIDKARGEVLVAPIKASNDIQMGDLLYVRIEGKIVQLRATFPMQTLTKCRAEGENRAMWTKIEKGMAVYRYNKSLKDSDASVKADPERGSTRRRFSPGE